MFDSINAAPVPVDAQILLTKLLQDLDVPSDIIKLQSSVQFEGGPPFLPIPHKSQAASAALLALLGICSSYLAQQRGARLAKVSVNTDHASLFLASFALGSLDNYPEGHPKFHEHISPTNEEPRSPLRHQATNVYKTKDNRFFHLHGSLHPSLTLKALKIDPDQAVDSEEEARSVIEVSSLKYTAEQLRQLYSDAGLVGDTILTPDEFDSSEQGKIINSLPLARFISIPVPGGPTRGIILPLLSLPESSKALCGIRVIELTRVIAGGVAGRLLSELGATVVRVIDKSLPDFSAFQPDFNLDKRPVYMNLRTSEGKMQMNHLLDTADVFLQGYRPGVMNRLGLSHENLAAVGARRGKPFIIIDEACYGGELEHAPSSMRPGYQQIADSVTGIAWQTGWACGKDSPIIPCLPISDYCTGILCASMAVLGLVKRQIHGETVACPVALLSMDLWLRKQEHYSAEWVRHTYRNSPQYDYTWDFAKMLSATIKHQRENRPEYFQSEFFHTLPSTPSSFAGKGAEKGQLGPSYTHLAPVIKFGGVQSTFTSTASWGDYRPGWDEADADILEEKVRRSLNEA